MPGDAPVVVDSAGCGAAMKDYGHLLGTPEADAFAARVRDFSEMVAERDPLPVAATGRHASSCRTRATCATCSTRTARCARCSRGAYTLLETDDDGLCCGAGGAYALRQPELALAIRDRKVDALRRAGLDEPGTVVASANPGCMMHLRGAGLDARHPADLLAERTRG